MRCVCAAVAVPTCGAVHGVRGLRGAVAGSQGAGWLQTDTHVDNDRKLRVNATQQAALPMAPLSPVPSCLGAEHHLFSPIDVVIMGCADWAGRRRMPCM